MHIAQQRDLQAIQLAAEVLRRECSKEHGLGVMHQAIVVATDTGELSLANHYILRFLADLLGIPPVTLNTLFQELTGRALTPPEDPSRDAYWRVHDADYYAEQAREAEAARQRDREAQEKAEASQRQREEAERARAQAEREKAHHRQQRERSRHQERGSHRQSSQQGTSSTPPDRTTRALAVLGLMPGASKLEVRKAYRRMAQLHHPDRFYTESEHRIALASARFQRIKSAYDYLMHTYQ